MSLNDTWEQAVRQHRISDTVECRRAFLRGARAMLDELCDTEEEIGSLASLYTALARFERERC